MKQANIADSLVCRICDNPEGNERYVVHEMMYGSMDKFDYFQCTSCGCLQIENMPESMELYYPDNYYSLSPINNDISLQKIAKNLITKFRDNHTFYGKNVVGSLINKFYPNDYLQMLSKLELPKTARILDVGCGVGVGLKSLSKLGFGNLLGIDPYIESNIEYSNDLEILKVSIYEIKDIFDIIIFSHSLEHLDNQLEILKKTESLLSPQGICVISTPTVSSYAWEFYRENWVQLDAPRHLYLHSITSMEKLADQAGFFIEQVEYDSNEFQFWGSEQYQKGVIHRASNSYSVNPSGSIFSKRDIRRFKRYAKELNLSKRGDRVVLYLKKLNI